MKKAALHNLGCKVNGYETEAMQRMLEEAGYEIVPFEEKADVYIINTCSVTNMADRKSRQMLHKAKKRNPGAVVVAAGCYVQAAKEELQKDLAVDLLIGNNKKKDLIPLLKAFEEGKATEEAVIDIHRSRDYEYLEINKTGEHTRAYVKVQDGCNQFCSYCIIPYTRGRVRSRSLADVVQEVERLASGGYQEVVLTGIHLSSYGIDLESESLLTLIQTVHQVEGIKRIRLGSLEPRIITEEFAGALAGMEKICPHFHLSLQSGCDTVLKRMNRRYDAAEYAEKCVILRKYFEHPALTTDVIVGFPGETEEEFAASQAFVDGIQFFETHIFKYSKRKGTKAAEMKDQVPEPVKQERSARLQRLHEQNTRIYKEFYVGKTVEILIEEEVVLDGVSYHTGHTREYMRAYLPAKGSRMGSIVSAVVERADRKEGLFVTEA